MSQTNKITFAVVALLVVAVAAVLVVSNYSPTQDTDTRNPSILNPESKAARFNSSDELASFIKSVNSQNNNNYYYARGGIAEAAGSGSTKATAPMTASADQSSAVSARGSSGSDYSTTNVQIAGVDEPDMVKNDGKYIFITFGNNISIVDAHPAANAKLLAVLDVNGTANELFLNEDKLVVFGQEHYVYKPYPMPEPMPTEKVAADAAVSSGSGSSGSAGVTLPSPSIARPDIDIYPPYYYEPQKSFIKIYDLSDPENPELEESIVYEGSYYDARMIGDNVYVIANQPINYYNETVVMPRLMVDGQESRIAATDIYYFDLPRYDYQLTTVMAFDINDASDLEKKSFLTGYTQTIFVSEDNIYLTAQKQVPYYDYQARIIEQVYLEVVNEETAQKIQAVIDSNDPSYEKTEKIQSIFETYYNNLPEDGKRALLEDVAKKQREIEEELQKEMHKTIIHKISVDGTEVSYQGRGEVPGNVLNQFSMDEHEGNFRIATTTGDFWQGKSQNNMYVLNEDLEIIGKLEDLASGERIYSVRFMGDRAYMVTFKKVDPLFVIDLSNPTAPTVLGELKIPGYSDYLHPYDENHVIGIGKEAVAASEDDVNSRDLNFAWYQGVKLSLFDVTDVANPKEISKFNIGDRGTDSEALYEHKAFLFDKDKQLLVIPITLHEINREQYPKGVPPTAHGDATFSGAYVLGLNVEDGFTYKGRITHLNSSEIDKMKSQRYFYSYTTQIRRSLYIDDTLYTISQRKVEAHNLDSLAQVATVTLPKEVQEYEIFY